MCEKFSYQIINTLSVNQAVFHYYWSEKVIIIKKTLVLVLASNMDIRCFF